MDLTDRFRRAVRHALGLRDGDTGELWRHGLYRARVDVCASDGSTVDVTFEDERLPPQKGAALRFGVPGAVAVVPAGAVVLVGWEKGDAARVYAVPSWESTTPTKLILNGTTVIAGAESGAQFVALSNLVNARLQALYTAIAGAAVTANDGGASLKANIITALQANGWPGGALTSTAAAQFKAK